VRGRQEATLGKRTLISLLAVGLVLCAAAYAGPSGGASAVTAVAAGEATSAGSAAVPADSDAEAEAAPDPAYVPDADYAAELAEFVRLASETVREGSPGTLLTTNFGRYPFDDRAIADGRRFFEALPDLDVVSVNVYPNDNRRVITALPGIVHAFKSLGRPVAVSEVGICTEHFGSHYQEFYLRTFILFLRLASPANIYVYELQDDLARSGGDACEARFGLKTGEGFPRPAYDSFVDALHLDGTVGVITHLYTSGASNLDFATYRANVDALAGEGLRHLSLAPAWWEMVHARDGEVVWDEERFQVLVDALEYAGGLDMAVRLHTAPPWREGMGKIEYRAVVRAYYERIATLPNVHTVQVFNEANLFRFTDYGRLAGGVGP